MTVDLLARKLGAQASSNATNALAAAIAASGRATQLPLASSISAISVDQALTGISTAGYGTAGLGPASYVSDSLATAALASAYPALCRQSTDGRYWRLLPQRGAISIEQAGAIPNSTAAAVSNVAAAKAVLAYLSTVAGGGVLTCGPGTFTFDATALGANGLVLPANTILRGERGTTIWTTTDQSAGMLVSAANVSEVRIENIELRGKVQMAYVNGGHIRHARITGALTSQTQYAETGINVASAFGGTGQTYNDGTNTLDGSDFGHTVAGTMLSVTMTGGLLGNTQQSRYVMSDYIPLDPAKRYVLDIQSAFLGGVGAASPMIFAYNASKAGLDVGQSNTPTNLFVPWVAGQNNYSTSIITGASFIRIALGSYRSYFTAVGLTCTFDLSKIALYSCANDSAAFVLANLSTQVSSGQLFLSACNDFTVSDCDLSMIDRSAVSLYACTGCRVQGNRFRYVLQGVSDTSGAGNIVTGNDFDMRFKTTGGAMLGSKAIRGRAISGTGSDKGDYSRNMIRGANWGIECLPNNAAYRNTCDENVIFAEFCGASLATGDWAVRNNRIILAPMAWCGIEIPGDAGSVLNSAHLEGNIIKYLDFSGYLGLGISASNVAKIVIRGGYIKAPVMIQNAGANSGGEALIDGVDGEYGCTALLGRDCSLIARFGRIVPYIICHPEGALTSAAVFDIQPYTPNTRIKLSADYVVSAASNLLFASGVADAWFSFGDVRASAYRPSELIRLAWNSNWTGSNVTFDRVMVNSANLNGNNLWLFSQNTPPTSAVLSMRKVCIGNKAAPVPYGNYPRSMVVGDPLISATDTGRSIGTLAAGASTSWTLTAPGAAVGDVYQVRSATIGGLTGLAVLAEATADDTIKLTATNISGASLTPASQTLTVFGSRPA